MSDIGRGYIVNGSAERNVPRKAGAFQTSEVMFHSQGRDFPDSATVRVGIGVQTGRVRWPVAQRDSFNADTLNADAVAVVVEGGTVKLLADATTEYERGKLDPLVFGKNLETIGGGPVPSGGYGIVLRGAAQGTIDNNIFVPLSPLQLGAHHREKNQPTLSTPVYDTRGTDKLEVSAGLHGAVRVAVLPQSGNPLRLEGETQLALNFGRSGGDEPKGSVTGYGLAAFGPFGNASIVKGQFSPRNYGYMAYERTKGPLTVHPDGAKDHHLIGTNEDGEHFQSAALSTEAFFLEPTSDGRNYNGPLKFDAVVKSIAKTGGFEYRAPIVWDNANHTHDGPTGTLRGKWVVAYSLTDSIITPGYTPIVEPVFPLPDPIPGQPVPAPVPINPVAPPVRIGPFEQVFPSWFGRPRPCILKGPPQPDKSTGVKGQLGFTMRDFAHMPNVFHLVSTAKLQVTTPVVGMEGIEACPPSYTHTPIDPLAGTHPIPGTADGVANFAPPELLEHQLRYDTAEVGTLSTPSFNIWSGGALGGNSVLGLGKLAGDLGSIVSGFRFQMDTAGDLNIWAVDDTGTLDATRTINFLTPTNIGGGSSKWTDNGTTLQPTDSRTLLVPSGTAGAPAYAFVGATNKGMFNAGSGALGFSTGGTERGRITSGGIWQLGGTAASNDILYVAQAIASDPAATTTAIRANVTAASIALTGSVNAFVANVNLTGSTGCTQIVSGGSNNITIGSTGTFGAAIENLTVSQTINAASTLNGNLYTINSSHVISNGTRSSTTDIGSDFTVNVSGGSGGRFMFPLRARITGNTGFASTQAAVLGQVSDLSPASSRFIAGVFGYNATAVATAITRQSYGIVCSANGLGFTTAVALTNQCDVRLYRSGTRELTLQGGTSSTTADLNVTSRVRVGDGSEALPAFTFINDTNTGINRGASGDTMAFITGGTTRVALSDANTIVANTLRNDSARVVARSTTSSDITLGANAHFVEVNTSGGDRTITMPAASTAGRVIIIKKTSTSNTLTVNAGGGDSIDGGSITTLSGSLQAYTLIADGSNTWRIISAY